jgi:hypothetical protein
MGADAAGYGARMARMLLLLATALALLAGCGGGDDGDSGGGDGPSREEFVADANEICRDGEEKIQEITSQGQQKL